MTVSDPTHDIAPAPDARAALSELRRGGHRVSAPRRQVVEALYAAPGPVSAEEIAGGLGGLTPPCDPGSVYRNLELLERVGLARHVHLGHGPGRYAPAAAGERDYFVCERCGTVRSADPGALEPVRQAIARAYGWRVRFSHFPIAGLCPRCTEEIECSD
ncbi:MAG TPA: transcriptional repressor [Thermoleophilaceae bacterium]|nr:transcriptional repressor [Thermoleophilaceae bacterium]